MSTPIKILHLEDKLSDADLVKRELKKNDISFELLLTSSKSGFEKALLTFKPDIILSDYSLPGFSGLAAFYIQQKKAPDIPFIVVSGTIGEESAVELIKCGITDYVLKNKLFTLPTKITRALREAEEQKEIKTINENLYRVKNLYAFISQVNQNIVRIKDEKIIFRNSCSMAIEFGKFKMAWIGLFDFDQKTITLVEQCGVDDCDLSLFTNTTYEDRGPQDYVLQTGNYFICGDIQNKPELESWKPFCFPHGVNSAIVLPIKKSGEIIGTFNLYSAEIGFAGKEEIKLLVELTDDISFALDLFEKAKKHKEIEQLLIKNERRFRALIEQSTDMTMLSTMHGTFIYGSPTVNKIFGYPKEEFIHKSAFTFFHPDDLPDLLQKRSEIMQTPGKSFSFQYRLMHKKGHWIWCEGTLTNMLREPGIQAFVANFKDISEKKMAEQQKEFDKNNLDALINNTNDLLWSVDRNFNLLTSNKAFDKMAMANFGKIIEKGETLFSPSLTPEIQQNLAKLYNRAFEGERYIETMHFDSPVEAWAEISYTPIRNGEMIVGAACHSRDTTENKKAEQVLAKEIKLTKKHQSMLLSAQINPHFIFNALNSVQYFILLQENIESGLNFVADFSLLMRNTLTNSKSEFIRISDEINFLELYLKLEQQRAATKFITKITVDPGVYVKDMYIPPMLIQPYLENAIIHGVGNSNKDNTILIRFSKTKSRIVCRITDNGVGRKRAMELRNLRAEQKDHESMGMNITETRINLLNELYDAPFFARVVDLVDERGEPTGTQVEITFPILSGEESN